MDLQTLWFAAVAVLWTGFLLLEGFDFGVAALLPVLGRRTSDSHHTPAWDSSWTWVITTGSLIAALGIGAALGATTLGLPIDADGTRVGGAFSGLGWPALLGAVAVLAFSLVHGALFLALKTDGPLRTAARTVALRWAPVAALPLLAWAGLVHLRSGTTATAVLWLLAALAVVVAWARIRVD